MTSVPSVSNTASSIEESVNGEYHPQPSAADSSKAKDTVQPASTGYFSWLWGSSKPKEAPAQQLSNQSGAELKALWLEGNQNLAELEYEVMQLRARLAAYQAVDPTFTQNRELMQELRIMRPSVAKVQKDLEQMESKLDELRTSIEKGRLYFAKRLEIEKLRYEAGFLERTALEISTKGDLSNHDIILLLKRCQVRHKELQQEIKKLSSDLGVHPPLLKA